MRLNEGNNNNNNNNNNWIVKKHKIQQLNWAQIIHVFFCFSYLCFDFRFHFIVLSLLSIRKKILLFQLIAHFYDLIRNDSCILTCALVKCVYCSISLNLDFDCFFAEPKYQNQCNYVLLLVSLFFVRFNVGVLSFLFIYWLYYR